MLVLAFMAFMVLVLVFRVLVLSSWFCGLGDGDGVTLCLLLPWLKGSPALFYFLSWAFLFHVFPLFFYSIKMSRDFSSLPFFQPSSNSAQCQVNILFTHTHSLTEYAYFRIFGYLGIFKNREIDARFLKIRTWRYLKTIVDAIWKSSLPARARETSAQKCALDIKCRKWKLKHCLG